MSLIQAVYSHLLQAAVVHTATTSTCGGLAMSGAGQAGYVMSTTAGTVQLTGQHLLGPGQFLLLSVNGVPYKVQLDLVN